MADLTGVVGGCAFMFWAQVKWVAVVYGIRLLFFCSTEEERKMKAS